MFSLFFNYYTYVFFILSMVKKKEFILPTHYLFLKVKKKNLLSGKYKNYCYHAEKLNKKQQTICSPFVPLQKRLLFFV